MSSLTGFLFADDYNTKANAVIGRRWQLKANKIHFQFSIFNFQLTLDCFAAFTTTVKGDHNFS
jgi:hypothetical protein